MRQYYTVHFYLLVQLLTSVNVPDYKIKLSHYTPRRRLGGADL
jgi:hypothetical protein